MSGGARRGLGPAVERGVQHAVTHLRDRRAHLPSLARERGDAVGPGVEGEGDTLVAHREQEPLGALDLPRPHPLLRFISLDAGLLGVEHLVPVKEEMRERVVLEAENAPRHLDLTLPDPPRHLSPSGERGEEYPGVHTHREPSRELHLCFPGGLGANFVEPIEESVGDLAL